MPSKITVATMSVAILIFTIATAPSTTAAPSDEACSLLTQAQITAAVGVPVVEGKYAATFKKTCTWTATNPSIGKGPSIITLFLEDARAFQAGKGAPAPSVVTPVTGLGDDAYYLAVADNVGLIVKKGTTAFKVAVYGQLPVPQKQAMEKTLAQQVVPNL